MAVQHFVLKPAVSLPPLVLGGAVLLVGAGVIAWSPSTVWTVVGVVTLLLGLVLPTIALVRALTRTHVITLDDVGIRMTQPRPFDIGWPEVTAVHASGRRLRIELRDRSQLVVNGDVYRRGFDEFQRALLARLEAYQA